MKDAVVPSFTDCCPDVHSLRLMDRTNFWLILSFSLLKNGAGDEASLLATELQKQNLQIPQLLPNIS